MLKIIYASTHHICKWLVHNNVERDRFHLNFDFKTSFTSVFKMSSCGDMETNNMQTARDYDDEKHGPKSPENERYFNEALGHLISNSVEIRDVSVKSQEYYALIVELKDASNLCHLGNLDANCRLWISYEFLGMVVQSDQFISSKTITHFPIKRDQFFWNGTCPSEIHIYICAQDRVLGATKVGIQSIFFGDSGTQVQLGKKEIISEVTPIGPDENESQLLSHQKPHIQLIIECNVFDHNDTSLSFTNRKDPSKINRSDPLLQILPKPVMEPLTCKVEEHIYEVAKHLSDAKLEIERKQNEWNTFVHREEKKFRSHLREKEEKVRNYLNLIIQQNQEEHSRTLELCRVEYRKLEARLKKCLREVEAKEREIARQHEEKEAILTKKLTEFDVKEKMLREEAQHLIDMEVRHLFFRNNLISSN